MDITRPNPFGSIKKPFGIILFRNLSPTWIKRYPPNPVPYFPQHWYFDRNLPYSISTNHTTHGFLPPPHTKTLVRISHKLDITKPSPFGTINILSEPFGIILWFGMFRNSTHSEPFPNSDKMVPSHSYPLFPPTLILWYINLLNSIITNSTSPLTAPCQLPPPPIKKTPAERIILQIGHQETQSFQNNNLSELLGIMLFQNLSDNVLFWNFQEYYSFITFPQLG